MADSFHVCDLLVFGYLRLYCPSNNVIPLELVDLCIQFHHNKFRIKDKNPPIIIQNGSYMIRFGIAGNNHTPIDQFRTICGQLKYQSMIMQIFPDWIKNNVGDTALQRRGILKLSYPIQSGSIIDFNDMEKVWKYCFEKKLSVDITERLIFLIQKSSNLPSNQEGIIKIMFESFNVYGLYLMPNALLTLFESNRTSGIVIDFGYESTEVIPIYNDNILSKCIHKLNIGGKHISEYFVQLCSERGYEFTVSSEITEANRAKELISYVALDYEKELEIAKTTSSIECNFEWENISIVTFGVERFKCTECLFKPELLNANSNYSKQYGIHKLIYLSIMKCNENIQELLCSNIVLCGGPSMHKGVDKRLKKELKLLFQQKKKSMEIEIIAPETRKYSSWIGASTMVSSTDFNKKWISRDDYDILGSSIIKNIH